MSGPGQQYQPSNALARVIDRQRWDEFDRTEVVRVEILNTGQKTDAIIMATIGISPPYYPVNSLVQVTILQGNTAAGVFVMGRAQQRPPKSRGDVEIIPLTGKRVFLGQATDAPDEKLVLIEGLRKDIETLHERIKDLASTQIVTAATNAVLGPLKVNAWDPPNETRGAANVYAEAEDE